MNRNHQLNDMENTEAQLRSWALRSPSARIEARLFKVAPVALRRAAPRGGSDGTCSESARTPHFSFQWLAPAMALLLVFCMLMNQRNPGPLALTNAQAQMAAIVISNQSAAAYLPGSFTRDANILSGEILESTNVRHSTSSISSLSSAKGTN
jgi:hypothetical protein